MKKPKQKLRATYLVTFRKVHPSKFKAGDAMLLVPLEDDLFFSEPLLLQIVDKPKKIKPPSAAGAYEYLASQSWKLPEFKLRKRP